MMELGFKSCQTNSGVHVLKLEALLHLRICGDTYQNIIVEYEC